MQAFVNSLIRSGTAALAAGATESGLDSLRRAVHEAEKLRDKTLLAQALLELGTALVHAVRGFDEEGSVLLRQCAELARSTGNATIGATGFRELGYVEALAGRRPAASDYLAQALNLASDPDALAGIHAVIGFNLVDWGKIDDGLNHYETSLELARRSGNRRREIWALGIGARGLLAADRLADAEAWLRCCLTLVDDQRWIAFRPWPMALLAESHLRQRIATAALRPNLEEAFALSCQLADPCWEAAVARTLALTHAAEDDLAPAMLWLSEARRRCARSTDGYAALQVEILANQVEFSARRGQHEAADTFAREWISMAARTHMDTHVARAAAFIRTLSETPKTAG
jgi:tetratricopeptide (TPR) repeat protein